MQRRRFLNGAMTGALALAFEQAGRSTYAQSGSPNPDAGSTERPQNAPAGPLRGVNLGSWLVVEKWMTPAVFRDTSAPDEYELCKALGAGAADRLNRHRETFITEDDFLWIKARGLNAVRLPVGHWALEATAPYVDASRFVDFAFEQAAKNGLKVLLDLHGAPGSQNGWDHSGRSGHLGWHSDAQNVQRTLSVLEGMAKRYGRHPALWGIELLNEPRWDVPLDTLKSYYQDAYRRIRPHTGRDVAIVLHDAFRPFEWKGFMTEPGFSHVFLDTHLYQAYTDADRKRTAQEHIAFAMDRKKHLDAMGQQLWTIVGEWSLGTPGEVWRGLSRFQVDTAKRGYGAAQLLSYDSTKGWFYWSYKMEQDSDWSFRHCVERGWLPDNHAL